MRLTRFASALFPEYTARIPRRTPRRGDHARGRDENRETPRWQRIASRSEICSQPRSLLARLRRRSVRRSPPNSRFHYSLDAPSLAVPLRRGRGETPRPQLGSKLLLLPLRGTRDAFHILSRFREFSIRLSSHRLKTPIRNIVNIRTVSKDPGHFRSLLLHEPFY